MGKKQTPYDFARGHPNPSLLPVHEMKELLHSIVANDDANNNTEEEEDDESDVARLCLNYGYDCGSPNLLSQLSSFLKRQTIHDELPPSPPRYENQNEFFMTHGVSHGIELLCATLTSPGDVVYVERPTYFLVADIFRAHGLQVRGLPMMMLSPPSPQKPVGRVDIPAFISLMESKQVTKPKLIYMIPTNQNPTGYTMTLEDRKLLADFAIQNGIVIVADEVYHLLDWRDDDDTLRRRKPARISMFNNYYNFKKEEEESRGCCISVSSFTKIYAPGIRVGWIEGPSHIISSIQNYGYIRSQGGVAPFLGDFLMHRALSSHTVDDFLKKLKKEYAKRAMRLCDILKEEPRIVIPNGIPTGGYFLWIKFPQNVKAVEFLAYCQEGGGAAELGVRFRPGVKCDAFEGETSKDDGGMDAIDGISGVSVSNFDSYARLCFADLDYDGLEEGARRLIRAFQMYMNEDR